MIEKSSLAPDFELADTTGHAVRLSDFRNRNAVILVLMRGLL